LHNNVILNDIPRQQDKILSVTDIFSSRIGNNTM